MPDLGPAELLIVLAIVVLVFGGSKLADLGGSLGKGIKEFKSAINEPDDSTPAAAASAPPAPMPAPVIPMASVAVPADARTCSACGTTNLASARFCAECGHSLAVADPTTGVTPESQV